MDAEEIRNHKAFQLRWYYSLELAPGLYTPGHDRVPVTQTRELLRSVDIESGGAGGEGARCLDVGTQEGMIPILLARRGAGEVVAYDRILRKNRLALAKQALGVDFQLLGDVKLQDFPAMLAEAGHDPFDVVVFSGVMYHMWDPLGGLAVVRGLVRNGGLCVVETSVALDDSDAMHFNRGGRFSPGALWFVTPRCLDYLLRLLRLEPLDIVYQEVSEAEEGKPAQGRLATVCRAVDSPVAEPEDEWISGSKNVNTAEFLDWDAVASEGPEVGYDGSREGLVRGKAGSIDLQASIAATEPFVADPEQTRLALAARY